MYKVIVYLYHYELALLAIDLEASSRDLFSSVEAHGLPASGE